jgi:pimeloyl-ACP methyl ester carboxylesterase
VLLHGWPSTWYEWRRVMPLLALRHRLVVPDLRGLGDSSRPLDGYDKKTVAGDLWQLLSGVLGLARWHLVGHDWGGPVAFALAAAHPDAVRTLAIVDVTLPGIGPDISQGGKRWHHAFHMTPDLPEALVQGRERAYLTWFYESFSWQRDAIGADDIDEYLRTYQQPGALRAGFAYYRNIPRDSADNRSLVDSGLRLAMPVLAVGGGRAEARGRGSEPEASLKVIASDVRGAVIADSGHFVPEEQPEALSALLLEHFKRG